MTACAVPDCTRQAPPPARLCRECAVWVPRTLKEATAAARHAVARAEASLDETVTAGGDVAAAAEELETWRACLRRCHDDELASASRWLMREG